MSKFAEQDLAGNIYAGGPLTSTLPPQDFQLGAFAISWGGSEVPALQIVQTAEPERILWSNETGVSFLTASIGRADVPESRGFFQIKETLLRCARNQVLSAFEYDESHLALKGHFDDEPGSTWELKFHQIDDAQLGIQASASFKKSRCNRLCLSNTSHANEEFFGFGAQFTNLRMKGRRIPVLSQEPGIGRGIQPLTWVLETFFKAGGKWWNSNAPAPMCLSTDLRGFCLENTEYSVFDLRSEESIRIGVFSEALRGRLFYGADPIQLLEAYTRFCGRMRPLPEWAQQGAIIGMQGGTQAVRDTLAQLEAEGTPIAAFWLQDWVGARKTAIGWQLWWNWEVDHDRYPGWEDLLADLGSKGIRVLTYINPFLVDATSKGNVRRNLYREALDRGFCVLKDDGKPYPIMNTDFSAALVDLTNPDCRTWLKTIIKDNLIGAGASGWMADFGEALPFDAQLHDGRDAALYHNQYPVDWAQLNREAIVEAGLEDDILFFTRAGYHRSPGQSTLFWLGDQLTSWTREDGIKSVVIALLSSGLSGMSLNHGDIGGYTATTVPSLPFSIPFFSFSRGQELMLRWIELSAFTAVYRTHEGNQPRRNHQITDDPATTAHFARFARVYAALGDYRKKLCIDARDSGLPLVRHPWLHWPDDAVVRTLEMQFALGNEFMVAPVLDPGTNHVRIYLPKGEWTHLWSGQSITMETGDWLVCATVLGAPAVFYNVAGKSGASVRAALAATDDLGGPWSEDVFKIDTP